jgi:hypothetical protein
MLINGYEYPIGEAGCLVSDGGYSARLPAAQPPSSHAREDENAVLWRVLHGMAPPTLPPGRMCDWLARRRALRALM